MIPPTVDSADIYAELDNYAQMASVPLVQGQPTVTVLSKTRPMTRQTVGNVEKFAGLGKYAQMASVPLAQELRTVVALQPILLLMILTAANVPMFVPEMMVV